MTATDLDYHDKQNCLACYKLFMFLYDRKSGTFQPNEAYKADLLKHKAETWGLYLYANMVNKFIGLYVYDDLSPEQIIEDASYVISFISTWYSIQLEVYNQCDTDDKLVKNQYLPKAAFIPKDTMQDVITTCNSIIYLTTYCEYFKVKDMPFIDRLSTRHNESMFAYMRRYAKTNSTLTTETACQYVSLYEIQLKANLCFPDLVKNRNRRHIQKTDKPRTELRDDKDRLKLE